MEYLSTLPGALNLALIWCVAGIGVYITYKILDIPDLTVDGSFVVGGIVASIIIANGGGVALAMIAGFAAGLLCGLVTGLLHTLLGIPPILSGILTQLALWSVNLLVSDGRANVPISPFKHDLFITQLFRYESLRRNSGALPGRWGVATAKMASWWPSPT